MIESVVFNRNQNFISRSQRFTLTVLLEMEVKKKNNLLRLYQKISIHNGGGEVPFTLDLKGVGIFGFEGNIENLDIDEIAHVNCAAIMFPFMRESVADIIGRSGLAPLLLPPTNFVNRYKEYKASKSKKTQSDDRSITEICTVNNKPKKIGVRRLQKQNP